MFSDVSDVIAKDYKARYQLLEKLEKKNKHPKNKKITLVWFHRKGAMALEINGNVYFPYLGIVHRIPLEDLIKKAKYNPAKAFYRIIFNGEAKKIADVERHLKIGLDVPFSTCSGCSIRLLSRCAEVKVPFYYSLVPSWASLSLLNQYQKESKIFKNIFRYPREDNRKEDTLKGKILILRDQLPLCVNQCLQFTIISVGLLAIFILFIAESTKTSTQT